MFNKPCVESKIKTPDIKNLRKNMNVKELIEKLQQFDQELVVSFMSYDNEDFCISDKVTSMFEEDANLFLTCEELK